MTLKIRKSRDIRSSIVHLSGRIESDHLSELQKITAASESGGIVFDLAEVKLADRDSVRFLAHCETDGIELKNCPAFIREWIEKEKDNTRLVQD